MEIDWEGNLRIISWKVQTNHNFTSIGPMLMEVDWEGKLKLNYTSCGCSMVDWKAHEIHPTGHSISEVDWGDHDPIPNHMNEKEFSIHGLWGDLQQRTSSTPPIELLIDSLATGQTEDDSFNSIPIDPDLDDSEQLTGKSIQSFLTLTGQLQWQVTLGRLATHA